MGFPNNVRPPFAVFGFRAHNGGQLAGPEITEPDAAADVPGPELYHPQEQCTAGGRGGNIRSDPVRVECKNEADGHGQVGVVLPEGGDIVQSR